MPTLVLACYHAVCTDVRRRPFPYKALTWAYAPTGRNPIQETTISVQFVLGMRFLVFDFAPYSLLPGPGLAALPHIRSARKRSENSRRGRGLPEKGALLVQSAESSPIMVEKGALLVQGW
eukprot:3936875-Rhodomonas_salina.2